MECSTERRFVVEPALEIVLAAIALAVAVCGLHGLKAAPLATLLV